jgi:hypothetical protein
VVKNTHTALVDEAIYDKAQQWLKIKQRREHTGRYNLFSGMLRCADCGRTLNWHVEGNNRVRYNCNGYKTRFIDGRKCSDHALNGKTLEQTVLAAINNLIEKANDPKTFAEYVDGMPDQTVDAKKSLGKMQKRLSELDTLIQRLYEKNAKGIVDDDAFSKLFTTYRNEQKSLDKAISEAKTAIRHTEINQENMLRFAGVVQSFTEPQTELTRELITTLIEKIVVHAPEGEKYQRNKPQKLDIIWRIRG